MRIYIYMMLPKYKAYLYSMYYIIMYGCIKGLYTVERARVDLLHSVGHNRKV